MIRTQIQLPDVLYRKLKKLAEIQETSLAEILRRAGEHELAAHPDIESAAIEWTLPPPVDLGIRSNVPASEWRLLANEPGPVRRALHTKPRHS